MKSLFDVTNIGTMKLKNRFIRSATGDMFAKDGHMSDEDFITYEKVAKSGVGTIITGYTYVSGIPCSPGMFGIYDDSFIPEYKKLTDMAHNHGVNIILQLVYCGSFTVVDVSDKRVLGPSAGVPHRFTNITSIEMTKEEIHDVQRTFADAAVRAKKAGFDGVQIHAAHDFLICQFLTPLYNHRDDEYGGSDENRARMLQETYDLMRKNVGKEYPIWVKINCPNALEGGISLDGYRYACKQLAENGIDAIEVSGLWQIYKGKDTFYFREFAESIAAENKVPVILVGGNRDFHAMTEVLNETNIGYFALCRPLIAEPELVKRWENGDLSKSKCVTCNSCTQLDHSDRCVLND